MFRAMVERHTTEAQITALLGKGKKMPADRLLPLVYDELRRLARARVARLGPGQTVRATELVHEAWLRVVAGGDPGWEGRGHFFGAAANAMRNILVEQARRRGSQKRDRKRQKPMPTDLPEIEHDLPFEDILTVHETLRDLEKAHPRAAKVVLLRFFGGQSMPEVAELVDSSLPTVERDWRFARSWLQDRINGKPADR
jgi:RNA polymerase sigma factor (TIGR02999 family)